MFWPKLCSLLTNLSREAKHVGNSTAENAVQKCLLPSDSMILLAMIKFMMIMRKMKRAMSPCKYPPSKAMMNPRIKIWGRLNRSRLIFWTYVVWAETIHFRLLHWVQKIEGKYLINYIKSKLS